MTQTLQPKKKESVKSVRKQSVKNESVKLNYSVKEIKTYLRQDILRLTKSVLIENSVSMKKNKLVYKQKEKKTMPKQVTWNLIVSVKLES